MSRAAGFEWPSCTSTSTASRAAAMSLPSAVIGRGAALVQAAVRVPPSSRTNGSTLPLSSTQMVSAVRLPISGRVCSMPWSRAAMASATCAKGSWSARSALRLPMPFTVVKSSKKARSVAVWKPMRRGQKLEPCPCPSR